MEMKRTILFSGSALVIFACAGMAAADTRAEPDPGRLQFRYLGESSGELVAAGRLSHPGGAAAGVVAWQASNGEQPGRFFIAGSMRRDGVLDQIHLEIAGAEAGRVYPIGPSCAREICGEVIVLLGWTGSVDDGAPEQACDLSAGEISFTRLTADRATGLFSGTGTCIARGGGESRFRIDNGVFDVPLTHS
jgi:hypothetical protein